MTAGKSTCSCLNSLTDYLKTWELSIQTKLDVIQQKIDENQKTYFKNMKEEISNLRNTLEPLIAVRNSTLLAINSTKTTPASTTTNTSRQQGPSHLTHQSLCNYNSQTYSSLNLNLIDNNKNSNNNNNFFFFCIRAER